MACDSVHYQFINKLGKEFLRFEKNITYGIFDILQISDINLFQHVKTLADYLNVGNQPIPL